MCLAASNSNTIHGRQSKWRLACLLQLWKQNSSGFKEKGRYILNTFGRIFFSFILFWFLNCNSSSSRFGVGGVGEGPGKLLLFLHILGPPSPINIHDTCRFISKSPCAMQKCKDNVCGIMALWHYGIKSLSKNDHFANRGEALIYWY